VKGAGLTRGCTIAWASPTSRREPEAAQGTTLHPQGWARTLHEAAAPMSDKFVGVDRAKAEFVVACRSEGPRWTAPNNPEGIAATVARLRTLTPALIVAEATGGDERALVAALAAAGLPLVVANPPAGACLCESDGPAREDGPLGCGSLGALRRARAPHAASAPGTGASTAGRAAAEPPAARQVDGGAQSARACDGVGAAELDRSHSLARARQVADVDRDLDQTIEHSPVWRAKENLLRSVPAWARS